jgi:CubicO group peptidase (beta-lactamase class C family)
MMDIDSQKPMTPDAIFRIYSMTKPITSVAMMMLYEEGAFRLSDPVSKYIPDFADVMVFAGKGKSGIYKTDCDQEMTIHQLFTHTSGLSYGFDDDSPVDKLYREAFFDELKLFDHDTHMVNPEGPALQVFVSALAKLPLRYQPGSHWCYSFSIDVLGYLVEVLSGERFDVFLQRRIFDPLKMVDIGFSIPESQLNRLTTMYTAGEKSELDVVDAPAKTPLTRHPNFFSGGGGLVSTASDYLRFAQMLLNKGELDGVRLLGRKTVEFMTRNHLSETVLQNRSDPLGTGVGFGLGGHVVMDAAQCRVLCSDGTFSWGGAARTDFWVDPQEELIGLFMIQLIGGNIPWLADDLRVLAYQAIVD